jgi:serine/threonine protein kinase
MKKGDTIRGYEIISEVKVGGNCTWAFAKYEGKDYFIKEFLSPVYPVEGSLGSAKTKEINKKKCEKFEKQQNEIKKMVSTCVSEGGNLIIAKEFFRHNAKYYKVTEKIDISSISIKEISKLPFENRLLILKTSSHCVRTLHNLNIVHGDLKPDNLLISENNYKGETSYIAKLIDFDDSYFSGNAPTRDYIGGDLAYYSPELQKYINESPDINQIDLKSDIFALGIIFCQYLTGSFPKKVTEKQSAATIVNSGMVISIKKSSDIPKAISNLIDSMLLYDKEKRPDIKQVFSELKNPDRMPDKPSKERPPGIHTRLGKDKPRDPEKKKDAPPKIKIHLGKREKNK